MARGSFYCSLFGLKNLWDVSLQVDLYKDEGGKMWDGRKEYYAMRFYSICNLLEMSRRGSNWWVGY